MTEEAQPVVKNNKLLQYPSDESADPGTSERTKDRERDGQESHGYMKERKREREADGLHW